jgi:hypothetical protein
MWHFLLTLAVWFFWIVTVMVTFAALAVGVLYVLTRKMHYPGRVAVHRPPTEQYVSTAESSAIAYLRAERYSERSIAAIIEAGRANPEMMEALTDAMQAHIKARKDDSARGLAGAARQGPGAT